MKKIFYLIFLFPFIASAQPGVVLIGDTVKSFDPATGQYVQLTKLVPSQIGQSGKVVSSNGTSYIWITPFDGVYSSLTGKPALFDGVYNSLTSKPDLTVYKLKTDTGRVGGNSVTAVSLKWVLDSISAAMAAGYSTISHTHTFASLTSKPTTISGYGITDAVANTITVNGHALSGNVNVTATDLSLNNVTNTSDANKPVSTAQQTALDLKANSASPTITGTAALPIVTISGKITNYNSVATVSNGMPSIPATIDLTAQAANIGTTTLYAVPSAGFYRVSIYITITQAATTSSTMPSTTIAYTDGNSGTNSHSTTTTATNASNSITTSFAQTTYILYAKASTNITYATGSYASSGATPMQYAIRIRVESL